MDLLEYQKKKGTQRHPWELARYKVALSLIRKTFKKELPKNVWDVGCGDTFFVETLSKDLPKADFSAVDIEFTEQLIEVYNERINSDRIRLYKNINEIKSVEQVDLVVLMDVLEHIEEDVAFLQMLLTQPGINENTCFFITVPAFQSLFCSHDRFLLHYRRYSNKSLRKAVGAAGLQTKEIGYFFSSLLLPRQLQVWQERRQEKRNKVEIKPEDTTGLVEWKAGTAKTSFYRNILVADFRIGQFFKLMGIKLPGLSNYVICYPKPA